MDSAIDCSRVQVTLGDTKVLNDVSLKIPAGKTIGLLGPSGAGKTTLLRAIIGRQVITKGSVTVLGLPAGSPKLRTQIGYMPQSPALYGDLTLTENMRYFATMLCVPASAVPKVLHKVELTPQANQLAATLSGGQKARASLAVALLGEPRLLVLDEPTVGIDPLLRQKLWKLFRQLAGAGVTLLISSHVMDEADHCDDLLLIRRGRLLAQGSPESLRHRTHTQTIEQAFIALVGGPR